MTVTEALLEGLKVTAVGLAIVFSVLIILMLILMLMKVVFAKEPKKTVEVVEAKPQEAIPAPIEVKAEDDIDEEELIAVLTAAIAASLNTSTYNLQIKSYRRIANNAPAWNKAGIRDTIDSRF